MNKLTLLILAFICATIKALAQPEIPPELLQQLPLRPGECYEALATTAPLPGSPDLSVWILPRLADSSDGLFELDSYVALVDKGGKVIARYTESHATNGWVSDAVRLDRIEIDTTHYRLKDGARAFGVRVIYRGSSRPNPYDYTALSLLVQEGDSLHCVLKQYETELFTGEWDTNCAGTFTENSLRLKSAASKTNNFYDLLATGTVKHLTSYVVGGDCKEKARRQPVRKTLRYHRGAYR